MNQASIVKFDDVKRSPEVRMTIPSPIHIGSKVRLAFKITQVSNGRTEELRVNGEFQVTSVINDLTKGRSVMRVTISSIGVAPSWVAIKTPPARKLGPTLNGPTKVL
jgi:hypothetical protein